MTRNSDNAVIDRGIPVSQIEMEEAKDTVSAST
jgi:hypothetical protein